MHGDEESPFPMGRRGPPRDPNTGRFVGTEVKAEVDADELEALVNGSVQACVESVLPEVVDGRVAAAVAFWESALATEKQFRQEADAAHSRELEVLRGEYTTALATQKAESAVALALAEGRLEKSISAAVATLNAELHSLQSKCSEYEVVTRGNAFTCVALKGVYERLCSFQCMQ